MKLVITLLAVIVLSVPKSEAQGFFGSHSSRQTNFQKSEAYSLPTSRKRNSNSNFNRQDGAPSVKNSFQQHYTPSNLIRNPVFPQPNNQPFHSNFQNGFVANSPIRFANPFPQSSSSNRPNNQLSQNSNNRFPPSKLHQQPQFSQKQFNPSSFVSNNQNRSQVIPTRSPLQRNQNNVVTFVQPGLLGKGPIQNSHRAQSHPQQSNENNPSLSQNHPSIGIRTIPLNTHRKSLSDPQKSATAKTLTNERFKNQNIKTPLTPGTNKFDSNFHQSKNIVNKLPDTSLNRFSEHGSFIGKTNQNSGVVVKKIQSNVDTIHKKSSTLQSRGNVNGKKISEKGTLVFNGSKSRANLNLQSLLPKETDTIQFKDSINVKKVDVHPSTTSLEPNTSLLLNVQMPKNLFHSSSKEGYNSLKSKVDSKRSDSTRIHEQHKTLEIVSYPSKSEDKESLSQSVKNDSDLVSSSITKEPAFEVDPDEYKAFMDWVKKNRDKMGPGATTTTKTSTLSSSTLHSLPPLKLTTFLHSISTNRPQTTSSTTYLTTLSTTQAAFINTTPSSTFKTFLFNSSPSRLYETTTTFSSTSTISTTIEPPLSLAQTTKSIFRPKFRNLKRIRNYNARFRPKPMSYFQRYREQKLSTKKNTPGDIETKLENITSTTLKPKYFVLNKSRKVQKWRPRKKNLSKLRIHKNRESQIGKQEKVVRLLSSSARKPFIFKSFLKTPPSSVVVETNNISISNASAASSTLNTTAILIDVTIPMEGNYTSSTTMAINSTASSIKEVTTVTSIIDDLIDSSTLIPSLSETYTLPSVFEVMDIRNENKTNEQILSTSLNPEVSDGLIENKMDEPLISTSLNNEVTDILNENKTDEQILSTLLNLEVTDILSTNLTNEQILSRSSNPEVTDILTTNITNEYILPTSLVPEATDIINENKMGEQIISTSVNPDFTIETTTLSSETLKMTDYDNDISTALENRDVSEKTLLNTSKVENIPRILPTPLPYILSNPKIIASSLASVQDHISSTTTHIPLRDDKTSTSVFPQHIKSNSNVPSNPDLNLESISGVTISPLQESNRRSDTDIPAFLKDAIPMKDIFNLTDVKVISHRNMNFSGG
ncbi:uncharacterized protein [Lepeophtheirus salmonis]|uniref:uncharacterized protein n=1 Tax=Lepeophtheirus salmonis TaxID=72036 RepID=UPI001AE953C3|nr:nuclear pore complex protein DDB_G0274915-like [Lepeophtheirus salmonis]